MTRSRQQTKFGDARDTFKVLCYSCGTNCDLHYDSDADQFICDICIDKEQEDIDFEDIEEDDSEEWEDNYGQELNRRNK